MELIGELFEEETNKFDYSKNLHKYMLKKPCSSQDASKTA